jgi:hypothetical protein
VSNQNPNTPDPHVVKIENVRLSFPQLFQAKQGKDANGQPQGKAVFSAVFILDKVKNKADIDRLTKAALFTKQEKWQGKPVNLTGKSIRDGNEKEATDGYGPSIMFISARNEKRPGVVNRDLTPLTAEDGKPYAGCYVNATVRCWAQDNGYGKRINWALRNVQFLKDGEPFGEKPVAAEQEFTAVADDGEGGVDADANSQI